jgi:hypothetical protein
MTVEDLIMLLEDLPPEATVRMAMQPRWPLESEIETVVSVEFEEQPEPPEDDEDWEEDEDGAWVDNDHKGTIVYLGEGTSVGYVSTAAVNQLGWGRR